MEEGIDFGWYMIHVSICGEMNTLADHEGRETYCGAIPNMSAVMSRDMTPPKKEILSRVRTTFAECHDAVSDVMRVDT